MIQRLLQRNALLIHDATQGLLSGKVFGKEWPRYHDEWLIGGPQPDQQFLAFFGLYPIGYPDDSFAMILALIRNDESGFTSDELISFALRATVPLDVQRDQQHDIDTPSPERCEVLFREHVSAALEHYLPAVLMALYGEPGKSLRSICLFHQDTLSSEYCLQQIHKANRVQGESLCLN